MSQLSLAKPAEVQDEIEIGPLFVAMHDATSAGVVKQQKRGKQKEVEESTDSNNAEDDEDSSSSEAVVGRPPRDAPAVRVPVSSHFHKELGIPLAEAVHPGRASCRICSQKICKEQARLTWQYDRKRPHGYVHAGCSHRLRPPQDAEVLTRLQEIETTGLGDEVLVDITAVVRSFKAVLLPCRRVDR